MTTDERFMMRCLQLARRGSLTTAPNPMVGAVIVHEGRIIGEGWHRAYGGPHAEVNAVRSVRPADRALLHAATIYVSLEPCSHWGKTPPCAELLVEKGFRRVVVGSSDPNAKVCGRGVARLREAGAEVVVGVLGEECRWLNRKFFTQHELRRPYVTLKWAESADGFMDRCRMSHADGEAVRFSTPWTQMLVHRLRATHEAILVGHRTWELDQPSLTTRMWPGRNPLRIVLQGKRLTSVGEEPSPDVVAVSSLDDCLRPLRLSSGETREVQSILVEGGAQTLQSFIDADLWDEAYVERSAIVLGDGVRAPQFQTDPKGRPIHVNFA